MNCYDCALAGTVTPAVAVCHDCGASVCIVHSVTRQRHLTRTVTINRTITVEPPARLLRCATCATAKDAVRRDASPKRRHAHSHRGVKELSVHDE